MDFVGKKRKNISVCSTSFAGPLQQTTYNTSSSDCAVEGTWKNVAQQITLINNALQEKYTASVEKAAHEDIHLKTMLGEKIPNIHPAYLVYTGDSTIYGELAEKINMNSFLKNHIYKSVTDGDTRQNEWKELPVRASDFEKAMKSEKKTPHDLLAIYCVEIQDKNSALQTKSKHSKKFGKMSWIKQIVCVGFVKIFECKYFGADAVSSEKITKFYKGRRLFRHQSDSHKGVKEVLCHGVSLVEADNHIRGVFNYLEMESFNVESLSPQKRPLVVFTKTALHHDQRVAQVEIRHLVLSYTWTDQIMYKMKAPISEKDGLRICYEQNDIWYKSVSESQCACMENDCLSCWNSHLYLFDGTFDELPALIFSKDVRDSYLGGVVSETFKFENAVHQKSLYYLKKGVSREKMDDHLFHYLHQDFSGEKTPVSFSDEMRRVQATVFAYRFLGLYKFLRDSRENGVPELLLTLHHMEMLRLRTILQNSPIEQLMRVVCKNNMLEELSNQIMSQQYGWDGIHAVNMPLLIIKTHFYNIESLFQNSGHEMKITRDEKLDKCILVKLKEINEDLKKRNVGYLFQQ